MTTTQQSTHQAIGRPDGSVAARDRSQRALALTGPAAAVLMLAGLFESNIETSASDGRIAAWLATHGDAAWMAHAAASVLGATLLVVFAQVVRTRLDVGTGSLAARLISPLGGLVAAAVYAGSALFAAVPVGRFFEGAPDPDPSVYRYLLAAAASVMVIFVSLPAAAFAASVSVTGLRARTMPRWLGWAGVVLAVLMLLSAFVAPLMVFGLWLLVSGIALTISR